MKIVMLSTSDINGGAAVSCFRIHEAFVYNQIHSTLLVQDKRTNFKGVVNIADNKIKKNLALARYAFEKLVFLPYEKDKSIRFQYSTAITGVDLSKHPLVKGADIIHLNWINQGFLSIEDIGKILTLGKPVFWILHDMWSFTGGCHYAGDCNHYMVNCGNCKYLSHPKESDLSHRIWSRKQKAYKNANLTIVASSNWLANQARKSSLFSGLSVYDIPTPINSDIFYPLKKSDAKLKMGLQQHKQYLLFGAMSLGDERKGFSYFKEALSLLDQKDPNLKNKVEIILFGKGSDPAYLENIPFKVVFLGRLSTTEQLINAYSAADVFVLPTLEDNLPNTIIEALACGTPSVAFDCTGVPEIIDHMQNGYLASLKSSKGIADGIEWILQHNDYQKLSQAARDKVLTKFSGKSIAENYLSLYNRVLNK